LRNRHANAWRKARHALRDLPTGPRAAIKRYWDICGCPGDPVYLLTLIHEHRARKVFYWHVMGSSVAFDSASKNQANRFSCSSAELPQRELITYA